MLVGPKNVFGPTPNPKICPKGPKKVKKDPKWGRIENKEIGLYFEDQRDSLH